jgi:pyrophosphate--fructose-6-phosphate 1-phosphotransferase
MKISPLQHERYRYQPKLPAILQKPISNILVEIGEETESEDNQPKMKELFPHTYGKPIVRFKEGKSSRKQSPHNIGVVLSGGQAAGTT